METDKTQNNQQKKDKNGDFEQYIKLVQVLNELLDNDSVKQIYSDLLKPGSQQLGKAIGNLIGVGNTALAFMNESSRESFAYVLKKFKQKLEDVPPEKVVPVSPELGVPILESLSYIRDETLTELFLNLLSSASVEDTVSSAHPSFVHVIKNITADEARILIHILEVEFIPYETLRVHFKNKTFLDDHYRCTTLEKNVELVFTQNDHIYLYNLTGLGLLRPHDDAEFPDPQYYKEIEKVHNPKIKETKKIKGVKKIERIRGYYTLNSYGKLFCQACDIQNLTFPQPE